MEIDCKIAILTGASSGLGKAVAQALVHHGAVVYGVARNKKNLKKIEHQLGKKFHAVSMDITDQRAVEEWAAYTFSIEYSPDILINNAGIGGFSKVDEMKTEEWLNMINTNLNGLYFITSKLVALMKQKKQTTHILNVGSILGTLGRAEGTAYCATKFGVRGFSGVLAKELRFDAVKVTCLNPGSIDTGFFKSSGIDAHENMLQPQDIANTIIHVLQTPDNMLIDELTVRPLNPKRPTNKKRI